MDTFASLAPVLADARLLGFAFCEDGRDVEVTAQLPDGRQVTLRCREVTGLGVEFRYRPRTQGLPRACACTLEPLGKGRCAVEWVFPPHGYLEFECDAASLGMQPLELDAGHCSDA